MLTPLKELEYVIYPIPVHCYRTWYFQDSIDVQKLAAVQAKLNEMLELAQRKDMQWITMSKFNFQKVPFKNPLFFSWVP